MNLAEEHLLFAHQYYHPLKPLNTQINLSIFVLHYIMAPAAVEDIEIVTRHLPGDVSETPSPDGPLYAVPSSRSSSISTTTWLKLNSSAPTHIKVEVPATSHDEPFTGAKKLRHLLENTDELVVCPGVYDGLSARTAIELGFKSLYMVSPFIRLPIPLTNCS